MLVNTTDLVNWMFEAQSSELILEKKTVEFSTEWYMLPLDYYYLGYIYGSPQETIAIAIAQYIMLASINFVISSI